MTTRSLPDVDQIAEVSAITIDPRIREWIAPLRPDEYALLEASVHGDGCRDALITWNGILIDGHHRYAICQKFDLPFRVATMEFPDLDHVEVWVRQNQAGRRNLTDDQRAMNAAMQAEAESRIAMRERAKKGGRGRKKTENLQTAAIGKFTSRQHAAKTHGVSERRVSRAKAIKDKAPALADQVISGTVTIKDAERAVRETERKATREAAATAAQTTTADTDATIRHESFITTVHAIPEGSVSLVFTDPPYHDKTLGIYADLGTVAARVLKDGGSLITYTAHHRLPEVISMLEAAGLTFFWPLAMVHTGTKARMTEYGIVVHWKPLLWFVKGTFRSREDMRFVNDLIESAPEKDAHPWQQGIIEAQYYIEALTQPGDLVFDPFCGGGTTAVAAAHTLRRWISCDVDEEAVWIARQRLREAVAR